MASSTKRRYHGADGSLKNTQAQIDKINKDFVGGSILVDGDGQKHGVMDQPGCNIIRIDPTTREVVYEEVGLLTLSQPTTSDSHRFAAITEEAARGMRNCSPKSPEAAAFDREQNQANSEMLESLASASN